ncbi:MAG TPA: DNA polymerase I [Ktedonobacteraceae bacterium]|nr:DNA polymerase I [Ktedonobacteraceae bacterium]
MTEITETQAEATRRKTLMVVDGHAMIHRAFHAVPEDLSTSKGEVVNATFGFTSILIKELGEIQPDYVAVTFDRSAPTFRHVEYPAYKAHRPALPDIMRPQFARIREVVEAFGIPVYEKDGYEADDVIGTLSVQATQMGVDTIILTGDMDTLQLINEHVKVKIAKRGISDVTEYGIQQVIDRYGLPPARLPDFKGLVGDKSDNIPGVPGIGEKTATKLLSEYGDLEGVLAHIDELTPKEQRLLREKSEQALQSKHLATIVLDAPVQLDLQASHVGQVKREQAVALFRELEFRTLVDKIPGGARSSSGDAEQVPAPAPAPEDDLREAAPLGIVSIITPPMPPAIASISLPGAQVNASQAQKPLPAKSAASVVGRASIAGVAAAEQDEVLQPSLFETLKPEPTRQLRIPTLPQSAKQEQPVSYFIDAKESMQTRTTIIDDEQALRELAQRMRRAGAFALDTETTSDDPWHAKLVGISVAMMPGEAFYIPVGHTQTVDGQEVDKQLPLAHVLEQLKPVLEDANARKYMHNAKYDMLMLLRNGITVKGLTFDTMVGAYLIDPGRRGLGLKDQVFQRLGHVMTEIAKLIGSGSKAITMAQVPVQLAAEYAGADADMTLRLVASISEELRRYNLLDLFYNIEMPLLPVLMQMEIYGVALDSVFLRELNIKFSEQIKALEKEIYASVGHEFNINSTRQLGDILFVELKLPAGKKNKTGFSVSADVIESLRGRHPMVDHLLEYRQFSKLKSTYVDGLLALMDPEAGRVHTTFSQTTASSGRLSSSNPNLQNIPVRTEVGRQLRRAFIAAPGYALLTADYSQIELRILAHITHEPRLVEAFNAGEDIHSTIASSLFGIPLAEVTKDQRRLAKTVVYAVLYGQSAFGLAQITNMSNSEAAEFIRRYHETFPHIKEYVDRTLTQARKQGYVNTMYGRKRFFPDMHGLPFSERQALEREAVNMPIQGSNADLIKIAMIRIQHTIEEQHLSTRMILQVHDELVFEVPDGELEQARKLVRREMEGVEKLVVPIKVEMKVGRNWYEAETME